MSPKMRPVAGLIRALLVMCATTYSCGKEDVVTTSKEKEPAEEQVDPAAFKKWLIEKQSFTTDMDPLTERIHQVKFWEEDNITYITYMVLKDRIPVFDGIKMEYEPIPRMEYAPIPSRDWFRVFEGPRPLKKGDPYEYESKSGTFVIERNRLSATFTNKETGNLPPSGGLGVKSSKIQENVRYTIQRVSVKTSAKELLFLGGWRFMKSPRFPWY